MAKRIITTLTAILLLVVLVACGGTSTTEAPAESPAAAEASTEPSPSVEASTEPSPSAEADSAVADYRAAIVDQSKQLTDSLTHFTELSGAPDLFNDDWRLNVAYEWATWRTLNEEVKALTPPPGYEAFHEKYVAALGKLDEASHDGANGLDNLDPELIGAGTAKVVEASNLIKEATALIPPAP